MISQGLSPNLSICSTFPDLEFVDKRLLLGMSSQVEFGRLAAPGSETMVPVVACAPRPMRPTAV